MMPFERTDEGEPVFPLTPVGRDLGDEGESVRGSQSEAVAYYFVDLRDKDVLGLLSTEYIAKLEELVAEAEMIFGHPAIPPPWHKQTIKDRIVKFKRRAWMWSPCHNLRRWRHRAGTDRCGKRRTVRVFPQTQICNSFCPTVHSQRG